MKKEKVKPIMGQYAKMLQRVLSGRSDANIRFPELVQLLSRVGFTQRVHGDHHFVTKEGVDEIINLLLKRALAKPYQVKQVRGVIHRYKLGVDDHE